MNLYHISQEENDDYDTYSDMVVAAKSEGAAALIHPGDRSMYEDNYTHPSYVVPTLEDVWKNNSDCWCSSPDKVKVKYIGKAAASIKKGIICASFHAG